MTGNVQVGILGPLEVRVAGVPVRLPGERLRALLCRLAVDAPRPVGTGELIDGVWAEHPPADAGHALQSLVSRLRNALGGPGAVLADAGGYRLPLDRDAVDALAFRDHLERGRRAARAGRNDAALSAFEEALALWRGPALTGMTHALYAIGLAAELEHLRLDAALGRFAAVLALGRGEDVVTDLQRMVDDHPLREDIATQLITALAGCGRGSEALSEYERIRHALVEHLGADPGPELRDLHMQLLRGELGSENPARPPARRRRQATLGIPLTSFVGREAELDRVGSSVATNRLTTLVGPGGAGKTRLATEVARRWSADRHRPAWVVELAPVGSESGIDGAVLDALGMLETRLLDRPERFPQDDRDRLLDALAESARETEALLVIDNCEHLVSAVAELVVEIVAAAPQVRVLATSREPLGLTGETLAPVLPLALPPVGAGAEQAGEYSAVRLFCDRAAAARPEFTLDEACVADVITIVRRLDGLPLAIELAVARLRVLPVAEIATRLSDRFRLLTGGDRTSLPRHRTLAAVVDWSWELLTDPERRLAERLAVFPGGATEETATSICADELLPAKDVSQLLIMLTEKSLLQSQLGSPVRYRMLETLREYGIERLAEQGPAEENWLDRARGRHADHFARMVETAEPVLRSRAQLDALATLRAEEANVAAARRFLLDSGRLHDALLMTLATAWLNMITGNTREVGWLDEVIEAHRDIDEPCLVYAESLRAMAWLGDGLEAATGDGLRSGLADLHRRLRAAPVPPPFGGLAAVLAILPMWAGLTEETEASITRTSSSPDPWIRAVVHASAAGWAENTGDSERVRSEIGLAERGLGAVGDRWVIAAVTGTRAQLRLVDGDSSGALDDLETALRATAELGAADDARFLRMRIAGVLSSLGRAAEARQELVDLRTDGETPWRGADENVLIDAMLISIDWMDGDRDAALRSADDIRGRLSEDEPDEEAGQGGHVIAIALSAVALVYATDPEARPERLDQALADLCRAYPAACRTEDMPIVAQLGPALAQVAAALGRFADATEILGAAARLRGGDATTDPVAGLLAERLLAELGDKFDQHYRRGRALDRQEAVERMDPARLRPPPQEAPARAG